MRTETSDSTALRLPWLMGLALVLFLFATSLWWPGCRRYPAVTSRDSLRLLQILNTACNTRNPARLEEFQRRMKDLDNQGKLSTGELRSYERILSLARSGKWEDAESAALRMARDQVGVGHPDPEEHERKPTQRNPRMKTR